MTKDTGHPVNQSKLEANTCSRQIARENECARVTIGFGFTSDWLRKWREFFKPITERSNAKPKQTRITFNTQVKIALILKGRRGGKQFGKLILSSWLDQLFCTLTYFNSRHMMTCSMIILRWLDWIF